MKRNKGFTLIELLAVIVILAIIALIATPIILNVINDARKSAAKDSAYGYIEAIETQNQLAILDSEKYSKIESGDVTNLNSRVNVKGTKPTSGTVTIENGKVTSATLTINGYELTYDGDKVTIGGSSNSEDSSTPEPTPTVHKPSVTSVSGATHKGIVYLNPTDLTVECTESNSQIGTGAANASGCMKFYIFDDSGDTYKMILDHNTTAKVAWNSERTNTEMKEVATQLATDTAGWVGSPRIISAQEIANITNTSTFDGSDSTWFYFNGTGNNKQTKTSSSRGDNIYAWLFDYTIDCEKYGCNTVDSNISAYWTSSPVTDYSYLAWGVYNDGTLRNTAGFVYNANNLGIRPVITIPKSDIQ